MVIMNDGAYTQRTAQEVASALHHLIMHPEANNTTRLDIRIERRPSGTSPVVRKESTFWVKPIQPLSEAVVSLVDGREIVRLITDDGQRLDVFFGKPEERSFEPALVILASE